MYELLVVADDGKVVVRQEYVMLSSALIDAEHYDKKLGYKHVSIRED